MVNLDELGTFLLKANKPHAYGTAEMKEKKNGSRTITFVDGDWSMEDNFFGGEPYGGQQVIFHNSEPVWICVYYGRVLGALQNAEEVYTFLRKALQHPDATKPQRGPESYIKRDLRYQNKIIGNLGEFSGREIILRDDEEIYWATYLGGIIDHRFNGSI